MGKFAHPIDVLGDFGQVGPDCNMVANDMLLPVQWYNRSAHQAPEHKLLLAVLEDALNNWMKTHWVKARDAERLIDAHCWIFRNAPALFSFQGVCDALDLNADYVRRGLRAWQHKQGLVDPEMSPDGAWRSRFSVKTNIARRSPVKHHATIKACRGRANA